MKHYLLLLGLGLLLVSGNSFANRCAEINSWTGCYLEDNAAGCNKKVVKIDYTNVEGETLTHWINKTDIRDEPELKQHITAMMRNYLTVNAYIDTHCADGPCLTGHEHLCQE